MSGAESEIQTNDYKKQYPERNIMGKYVPSVLQYVMTSKLLKIQGYSNRKHLYFQLDHKTQCPGRNVMGKCVQSSPGIKPKCADFESDTPTVYSDFNII